MASQTGDIPSGELSLVSELPANLLRRRPDVRAAERQMAAQSALIGVAESELYPSISLIGSVGISGRSESNGTLSWAAGPTFSWNLLDQGRLGNQVLVQDARFLQLHEHYRDTVFQAAREVDDAAIAYANDKDEIVLLTQTGKAASRSLEIANTQYREGMADFQRVLDSQRALFNQQERLVSSRGAAMRDLIALYKALGGGWESGRTRPLVDAATESHLRQRDNWLPLLNTRFLPPHPLQKDLRHECLLPFTRTSQPSYGHRPGGADCTADLLVFSHGQSDALYLAGQGTGLRHSGRSGSNRANKEGICS
jgi:hypothetical protein